MAPAKTNVVWKRTGGSGLTTISKGRDGLRKWQNESNMKHHLTLSCLGTRLVRIFALPVHISLNNGLIGMIQLRKVFVDVLAMRFACSTMQIGPLVAKLWC